MAQIIPVATLEHLEQFRALCIEYANGLQVDISFQGFQAELAGLPGDYAQPSGQMLLAMDQGQAVGCVAMRPLTDGACEMKRLFVQPSQRGKGAGRMLVEAIISGGRRLGYRTMKLDTVDGLREALALYLSYGFQYCEAYRHNPLIGAVFLKLDLAPVQVIKVSGSDLDDAQFSAQFAVCVAEVARSGAHPIIVHGGGKELTALLKAFQIESRFVDGLRVTDARTRDAALMTLSGLANKRLTAALLAQGVDALGVSGVDAGLVRVQPVDAMLQFVGKPVKVRAQLLHQWTQNSIVPVIAPMSVGADGEIYNVNADHVAGAVAAATNATMLTFVSNVAAVLDHTREPIANLTAAQTEALIADGTISGGMIPKARTALDALRAGVKNVRITNLDGLSAGAGTTFTH